MQSNRNDRASVAALLCACLLVNALVCSFHHAAHLGVQLLLGKSAFCLTGPQEKLRPDGEPAPLGSPAAPSELPFNCPLCTPSLLDLAALFCLAWLLLRRRPAAVRLSRERRCKAPPRYCWPTVNPRASPLPTC
ncbi:MAG TPA: DUF2946 domain-containing protein [Pseudomonas sp.]|nr:DUF2946 domain-containing protein [Pseudomonas sp.]